MRNSKPILLVEDDKVDAMTVKRAFRDLDVSRPVIVSVNGEKALQYLNDHNNIKPEIMLLDLNMPRMNGLELLKTLKSDSELAKIPVIVLTTSSSENDVVESFRLGASGYFVKPVDYEEFMTGLKTVNLYWSLSELPYEA